MDDYELLLCDEIDECITNYMLEKNQDRMSPLYNANKANFPTYVDFRGFFQLCRLKGRSIGFTATIKKTIATIANILLNIPTVTLNEMTFPSLW